MENKNYKEVKEFLEKNYREVQRAIVYRDLCLWEFLLEETEKGLTEKYINRILGEITTENETGFSDVEQLAAFVYDEIYKVAFNEGERYDIESIKDLEALLRDVEEIVMKAKDALGWN